MIRSSQQILVLAEAFTPNHPSLSTFPQDGTDLLSVSSQMATTTTRWTTGEQDAFSLKCFLCSPYSLAIMNLTKCTKSTTYQALLVKNYQISSKSKDSSLNIQVGKSHGVQFPKEGRNRHSKVNSQCFTRCLRCYNKAFDL